MFLEGGNRYMKMNEVRIKFGGISRTAFWRLRQLSDFPSGVQLTPGLLVWNESELDLYLEKRKVK
jgi:predicted DNA-binding transcriptional regulator AlpA